MEILQEFQTAGYLVFLKTLPSYHAGYLKTGEYPAKIHSAGWLLLTGSEKLIDNLEW